MFIAEKVNQLFRVVDQDGDRQMDPWEMYYWIIWVEGCANNHYFSSTNVSKVQKTQWSLWLVGWFNYPA